MTKGRSNMRRGKGWPLVGITWKDEEGDPQ
jgi:hypothetical protein